MGEVRRHANGRPFTIAPAHVWSEEEERLLVVFYPIHGPRWDGWKEYMGNVEWYVLSNRAQKLGLKKGKRWTKKDEEYVRRTVRAIARKTGRANSEVAHNAWEMFGPTGSY